MRVHNVIFDFPVLLFGSMPSGTRREQFSAGQNENCLRQSNFAACSLKMTSFRHDETNFRAHAHSAGNWQLPESSISEEDFGYITKVLGYKPLNALSVVNRTATGNPAVLKCYPLVPTKSGPEPFPTTFWICDPDIKTKLSSLEHAGLIASLKERLVENSAYMAEMRRCHEAYAEERWALLCDADRSYVKRAGWESRLRKTGIGGMRPEGYVKCLHIHYAHFLARWISRPSFSFQNLTHIAAGHKITSWDRGSATFWMKWHSEPKPAQGRPRGLHCPSIRVQSLTYQAPQSTSLFRAGLARRRIAGGRARCGARRGAARRLPARPHDRRGCPAGG